MPICSLAISKRSDHPHACGENTAGFRPARFLPGPSPRVWGKFQPLEPYHFAVRTIPTRVGKMICPQWQKTRTKDHPHACGENYPSQAVGPCALGPSPRVWGKFNEFFAADYYRWTIPTRVGKICYAARVARRAKDHPHACGENSHATPSRLASRGPSPRVWGKLSAGGTIVGRPRTIPTRVGKISSPEIFLRVFSDHPHACGENQRRAAV